MRVRSLFAGIMMALAILAGNIAAPHAAAQTAQEPVSAEDRATFERVIGAQIEAFRAGNAADAFSFAAPGIQAKFGTPATFMQMVTTGYGALVDPQSFAFGTVTDELGYPTQVATIIDRQGAAWTALYAFERQADGTWRISGCVLRRLNVGA